MRQAKVLKTVYKWRTFETTYTMSTFDHPSQFSLRPEDNMIKLSLQPPLRRYRATYSRLLVVVQ